MFLLGHSVVLLSRYGDWGWQQMELGIVQGLLWLAPVV